MSCRLPDKIGAGLTFERLVTLTAYPAPEWALSVHLRGKSAIDLQATAEGSQHRLREGADVTATWAPGDYWFTVRATRGTEVHEVEQGQLTITPDMASAGAGFDGRSHAQRCLEAIEAVLEKRSTLDQDRYRINNRELYRTPVAELMKLRDLYRAEVRREKQAASGKSIFGAIVRVRLK